MRFLLLLNTPLSHNSSRIINYNIYICNGLVYTCNSPEEGGNLSAGLLAECIAVFSCTSSSNNLAFHTHTGGKDLEFYRMSVL